jgi:hypothetical protein
LREITPETDPGSPEIPLEGKRRLAIASSILGVVAVASIGIETIGGGNIITEIEAVVAALASGTIAVKYGWDPFKTSVRNKILSATGHEVSSESTVA